MQKVGYALVKGVTESRELTGMPRNFALGFYATWAFFQVSFAKAAGLTYLASVGVVFTLGASSAVVLWLAVKLIWFAANRPIITRRKAFRVLRRELRLCRSQRSWNRGTLGNRSIYENYSADATDSTPAR